MSIRALISLGISMSLLLTAARSADFVIMVSVDGLRPAAIEQLRAGGELAYFARMQGEGVWTHNARADYDSTSTVPNHVSMATGRGVAGDEGHNYTSNGNPAESDTLHQNKGSYLASVFDVAHDHGLTTAFHRSKSKLAIIDQSYPTKLDITRFSVTASQSGSLMDLLEADLLAAPVHLTFLHLLDPDPVGHGSRWETPEYFEAVRRIDAYLGRLLALVEANEPYAGRTTIILTADHGGAGASHTDVENPENYTIPLYVWGADVPAAGDLYAINPATRSDPLGARPAYGMGVQPVRNGDMANLALDVLGLPPIPGSTINVLQDLAVSSAVPAGSRLVVRQLQTGSLQLRWWESGAATVQVSEDLVRWIDAPGTWPSEMRSWVDPEVAGDGRFYRVRFQ